MNTIAESIIITVVLITMAVCIFMYKDIASVQFDIMQMRETLRNLMEIIEVQKGKQNSKED